MLEPFFVAALIVRNLGVGERENEVLIGLTIVLRTGARKMGLRL